MEQERKTDVANEPVDTQDDEFMDTGVLHEQREPTTTRPRPSGIYEQCLDKSCTLPHPHPQEEEQ